MFILLITEIYEPVVIFFSALTIFVMVGIITLEEALQGFTNQGMLTIALLFILVGAVQKGSGVFRFVEKFFGKNRGDRSSLLKVITPITILSAFINNTPVVAMFVPIVRNWALDHNISPSRYLIPLSYASIFGGLLTLVGTSTNLIVSGMLQQYGEEGLWMFETTYIGLPLALTGIVYLLTFGYKVLPWNEDLMETMKKRQREYLVAMTVKPHCRIIGKTVEKAGLRNLKGLFLIEIMRGEETITPVTPGELILNGDRLIFTGQVSTIVQLQEIEGLKLETSSDAYLDNFKNGQGHIVEAVVSASFPFLGKTIKESSFRSKYDAAVVAVLRNGERNKDKIGNIKLKPGDTLLLLTGRSFINLWGASKDFYLISKVQDYELKNGKGYLPLIAFAMMILLAALNIVPILHAAFISLAVLFLAKTINHKEARKAINWDTIFVIAFSLGIGNALTKSGAAALLAEGLVSLMQTFGPIGLLLAVYLLTNLLTEMITNNAAAVLVFPIAISGALQMGVDPRPLAIAVAVAASASFSTPIGYQTNLMVFGPGGYKFKDFLKVGLPLNLIFMILSIFLIPIIWPF